MDVKRFLTLVPDRLIWVKVKFALEETKTKGYLFVSFEKWYSMFLLRYNIEGATEKVYKFHTLRAEFTTHYFLCNL